MKAYYIDKKRVTRPKSVVIDGVTVEYPNDQQILLAGYEIRVIDDPTKRPETTEGQKIERLIREKYTLGAELAIQRQRETKPEEFQKYFEYCEECKRKVKEENEEQQEEVTE